MAVHVGVGVIMMVAAASDGELGAISALGRAGVMRGPEQADGKASRDGCSDRNLLEHGENLLAKMVSKTLPAPPGQRALFRFPVPEFPPGAKGTVAADEDQVGLEQRLVRASPEAAANVVGQEVPA